MLAISVSTLVGPLKLVGATALTASRPPVNADTVNATSGGLAASAHASLIVPSKTTPMPDSSSPAITRTPFNRSCSNASLLSTDSFCIVSSGMPQTRISICDIDSPPLFVIVQDVR
ncbi:MAG: hypothetical protein B7Z52_01055 [Burkholderiales bacterium 12-64-5]|nr:MAG: hypothetical protein B7Z52_01055 [Burkholderiales bacterium 12-64-5]